MPGTKANYRYVSDTGANIRVRLDTRIATAGGFAAADGTEVEKPGGLRMRHLILKYAPTIGDPPHPGKVTERKVPVASTGGGLWTDAPVTINLLDYANTPIVQQPFVATGRVGEQLTY
jgi:hypothetical protein